MDVGIEKLIDAIGEPKRMFTISLVIIGGFAIRWMSDADSILSFALSALIVSGVVLATKMIRDGRRVKRFDETLKAIDEKIANHKKSGSPESEAKIQELSNIRTEINQRRKRLRPDEYR